MAEKNAEDQTDKTPMDAEELDEVAGGSSGFIKLDSEAKGATEEFLKLD